VRDRATTNRATQQHAKAKIESIETSATAGAMTGNAPSKKQPTFEQLSLANISLSSTRTDLSARLQKSIRYSGSLSRMSGGDDKDPMSLPMCVAASVAVLPFVMRFYCGGFGVKRQVQEALLASALGSCSFERRVYRMGGVSVALDRL
jgi:hypothetical protein